MKKLFIFDVDGVLLNLWDCMRPVFADFYKISLSENDWNGIIKDFLHDPKHYMEFGDYFDDSWTFGNLIPIAGMQELVMELEKRGFDLAIITGSSNKISLMEKRKKNLDQFFGKNSFTEVVCLGRSHSKKDALKDMVKGYDRVYFCDDNPKNLEVSVGIVSAPIWFANPHHEFMWENTSRYGIDTAHDVSDILRIVGR